MYGLVLQKCLILTCLYYLYLKPEFIQRATLADAYTPANQNPGLRNLAAQWSLDITKAKSASMATLEDTEPGFDLTKEEMIKFKIWPKGIIPYYIDDYSFDKVLRDRIRNFLELTSKLTGLHFMELLKPPEDTKMRWAFFVNRLGLLNCADHTTKNFTMEGLQKIVLGYDCLVTGDELSEAVLALVGVPPQHNAPNRDNYISVNERNILPEKMYLFEPLKNDEWLFHDVAYDFSSAGHYSSHKYSKNGFSTIQPADPRAGPIGESNGFTYFDIWKIRMLYNYISKKKNSITAPTCKKLFIPGANFSSYQVKSEDEIEPRKRPNKYLGLPDNPLQINNDDENKTHNQQNEDISFDTDEKLSDQNISTENNENTNIAKNSQKSYEENMSNDEFKIHSNDESEMQKISYKSFKHPNNLLHNLSDYDSDEKQ